MPLRGGAGSCGSEANEELTAKRMSRKQNNSDNYDANPIDTFVRHLSRSMKARETVVFCGAGISRHSGLPIVQDLEPYILKKLDVTQKDAEIITNSNLPFEAFMETLGRSSDPGKIFDIFDLGEPNTNHVLLAKLARVGYVTTVCTTNFDRLIERAFDCEGLVREDDYRVYYKEDDLGRIDWQDDTIRLIKIHGSVEDKDNMAIMLRQVASQVLSSQRKEVIDHIFCEGPHKHVLVLGYSCSDVFDISLQIEAIRENHKKVLFVDHGRGHERVVKDLVDRKVKNPFQHFGGGKWILFDTDELVKALWEFCLPKEEYIFLESAIGETAWQKCVNEWFSETEVEYSGANKHNITGLVLSAISEFENALKCYGRALGIARESGHKQAEGGSLGNIGLVYSILGKPDEALKYQQQALEIHKKIGDEQGVASDLGSIGVIFRDLGEPDEALRHYQKAIEFNGKIGDEQGVASDLGSIGVIFRDLGKPDQALKYQRQALEINRKIGHEQGIASNLGDIGRIHRDLGEPDQALRYQQQALEIHRKIGYEQGIASNRGDIGLIYSDLGKPDQALKYQQQALEIHRKIGHEQGIASDLGNIGLIYIILGNPDEALKYQQQALEINRKIGYEQGIANQLGNIGLIYSDLGKPDEALKYQQQALEINRKIGYEQGIASDLGNIGLIYRDLGKPDEALKYQQQALEIHRKIGHEQGIANQLASIGLVYSDLGKPDEALKYHQQALEIFRRAGARREIRIMLKNISVLQEEKKRGKGKSEDSNA